MSLLDVLTDGADEPLDDEAIERWTYTLRAVRGAPWHRLEADGKVIILYSKKNKDTDTRLMEIVRDRDTRMYTMLVALFETQHITATGYDKRGVPRCACTTSLQDVLRRTPDTMAINHTHRTLLDQLCRKERRQRKPRRSRWWLGVSVVVLGALTVVGHAFTLSKQRWPRSSQKRKK